MQRDSRIFVGAAALDFGRGGIASVARMTIRSLVKTNRRVSAVSYLDAAAPSLNGAAISVARGNKLLFLAQCHRHTFNAGAAIYDSAGIARARPRLPGLRRPFAVWMHGVEAWEGLRPAASAALRAADLVLVNSSFTLERYERLHGSLPRARVCWLATEEDALPTQPRDLSGPPTALILARIDPDDDYKGHSELIAAWPRVVERVPDARLVIAGGGPGLDTMRARVAASPAASQIDVLGFVPETALPALWARTTVFAMPSRGEGFGLVYIEAMRHGIPVLASTHDAAQEINVHGETGLNVDLDRDGELSGQLVTLLSDSELANHISAAGQGRWLTHFRFSAFSQRFQAACDLAGV